ncbi:hypothetical protein GQ53DRAFT_741090 [Thozetella sp. PMI_491]|nr:hypothetical protein GQ53DRAFT_741090 [Thozetella sp. PMI_491]
MRGHRRRAARLPRLFALCHLGLNSFGRSRDRDNNSPDGRTARRAFFCLARGLGPPTAREDHRCDPGPMIAQPPSSSGTGRSRIDWPHFHT